MSKADIPLFNSSHLSLTQHEGKANTINGPSPSDLFGDGSEEWVVHAGETTGRDWLHGSPVCAALQRYGIVHVGVASVVAPYSVVRTELSGTFVMASVEGCGEVFIDGNWQRLPSGLGCLAPPRICHSYRAIVAEPWTLAWIRYQEPQGAMPIVFAKQPVISSVAASNLYLAIKGLYDETQFKSDPARCHLWVELIESYSQDFTKPWRIENRLKLVWEQVKADLARPWTMDDLAELAGLSVRQLRRLQKSNGKSLKEYLTTLRMEEAIRLLIYSDKKVETIAHQIGYQSAFTFSSTFHRFTGFSPTEYRRHTQANSDRKK